MPKLVQEVHQQEQVMVTQQMEDKHQWEQDICHKDKHLLEQEQDTFHLDKHHLEQSQHKTQRLVHNRHIMVKPSPTSSWNGL